jgi:hypothetical protein
MVAWLGWAIGEEFMGKGNGAVVGAFIAVVITAFLTREKDARGMAPEPAALPAKPAPPPAARSAPPPAARPVLPPLPYTARWRAAQVEPEAAVPRSPARLHVCRDWPTRVHFPVQRTYRRLWGAELAEAMQWGHVAGSADCCRPWVPPVPTR